MSLVILRTVPQELSLISGGVGRSLSSQADFHVVLT